MESFRDEEDLRHYPPDDPYLKALGRLDDDVFALQYGDVDNDTPLNAEVRAGLLRLMIEQRTHYETYTLNRWWMLNEPMEE